MDQASVNRGGAQEHPWQPGWWRGWFDPWQSGPRVLLLAAVPIGLALWMSDSAKAAQFLCAGLAIVPLAGLMGRATEQLSLRLGPGIGGLLNATFGNAAELIIALFALFKGLDDVVKASLTGSIIGNLLLVLGGSLLAGGIKHTVQRFNRTAAGMGGTLTVLAAVGLLVPAIFHQLVSIQGRPGNLAPRLEHRLSVAVSLILLLTYALNLVFSLVTHRDLYNPASEDSTAAEEVAPATHPLEATLVLLLATATLALMSEVLVGAVEETSHLLGLTDLFVGVIVVAVVGNAAEHSTAVLMALRGKMDLALGIAIGSALQIALFVAPLLVLASYLRPEPMDLLFTTLEVVAVILAVMIARMVSEDGESNWLEGAMLLVIYAILGVAFFFLPTRAGG